MLHHEDVLVNNRMRWMAALQGLLFVSLGFAWGRARTQSLVAILCLLGVAVSLMVLAAMLLSTLAVRKHLLWWDARKIGYDGPHIIGFTPKNRWSLWTYTTPFNIVAFFFLLAWTAVSLIYFSVIHL